MLMGGVRAAAEAGEYAGAGLDLRRVSTATVIDKPKVSRKGWRKLTAACTDDLEAGGSLL